MLSNIYLPKNARQIFIDGPVGTLDSLEFKPFTENIILGIAIICHPDPKGGGTYNNKIVQTLAKILNNNGYLCICPNLRGVGQSDGEHDYGVGEVDDLHAIHNYLRNIYPKLPLILAGFSLGAAIVSQLASQVPHKKLILIAPAVTRLDVLNPDITNTIVIHGEKDDVVPVDKVLEWSKIKDQPIVLVPNTCHFFHGKLMLLQQILNAYNFKD